MQISTLPPVSRRSFSPIWVLTLLFGTLHAQGTFPPLAGPTTPVMRTLTQVEPRTPIPGPASYTITSPGSYYLTGNMATSSGSACITINADNVTLDLNGFTISGLGNAGTEDYGINVTGRKDVTIRNGIVKQACHGVFISAASTSANIRIEDLSIHQVFNSGIHSVTAFPNLCIHRCLIDTIGGSTVTSLAGYANGIYVIGAGTRVESCQIDGAKGGPAAGGAIAQGCAINLDDGCFSIGNTISNCDVGIISGKYQNNLTYNCTIPFKYGTDAGGNN